MLKKLLNTGGRFGFVAGLIVTFFDGLIMLKTNTKVTIGFPFQLIIFNLFLWTLLGCIAAGPLWLMRRKKILSQTQENYYGSFFFLLPFAFIYGLCSRFTPSFYSLAPRAYDHNASLFWVALFLGFLMINARRRKYSESIGRLHVLETIIIVAVFQFCSNLDQITWVDRIVSFSKTHAGLNRQHSLVLVYLVGLVALFGIYLLACRYISKIQMPPRRKIAGLAALVCCSLIIFYLAGQRQRLWPKNLAVDDFRTQAPPKVAPVILIVLDTAGSNHMSVYGYPRPTTKNLEIFSRDAMVYDNCIAASSWTKPSHASLFSGLYPVEHGFHRRPPMQRLAFPIPDNMETLAEIFKRNGYHTVGVAANHLMLHSKNRFDRGFDIFDNARSIGSSCKAPFKPLFLLFCYFANIQIDNFLYYRPVESINNDVFHSLDQLDSSSFFLFINYMDSHAPFCPPRPFSSAFSSTNLPGLERLKMEGAYLLKNALGTYSPELNQHQINQYDGALASLDSGLGDFFEELKKRGLYERSLIVVTSDHGELLGEHGLYWHNSNMYEGVLRVPLLIKYPFQKKTGREQKRISLPDIFATILAACGLPQPERISGQAYGGTSNQYVSSFFNNELGAHHAIYSGKYKYLRYEKKDFDELYDLEQDPLEKTNLATKLPAVRATMEKELEVWLTEHPPQFTYKAKEAVPDSSDVKAGLKALGYIQ